ncbi:MAG: UDP-N-acetylglucosamine 2-epimerase, partial [Pseudomonadota bacterium]
HEQGSSIRELLNDIDLAPDVCWTVRGTEERHGLLLAEIYMLLNELWSCAPASWLINYGYSKFTYPCISAAFQNDVAVAHIHDSDSSINDSKKKPRLEKVVSTISDVHFTTGLNIKNSLISEGVDERNIYSVGSTIPDFSRDVIGCKILEQKVSSSFREFINKTLDGFSHTKIVAIEANPSFAHFQDFSLLIQDRSELYPEYKVLFFSPYESHLKTNIENRGFSNTLNTLTLPQWDRYFLFTRSFCVLSESSETIDEARAFGALGLLLRDQTRRFDLLADGQVKLGGIEPTEWLNRLKVIIEKCSLKHEFRRLQSQTTLANLSATQQIASALTNRISEISQR